MPWLAEQIEYADKLVLPPGCRVDVFNPDQPGGFDKGAIRAAMDCAKRTGAIVAAVEGELRTIPRRILTGTRPSVQREPYHWVGDTKPPVADPITISVDAAEDQPAKTAHKDPATPVPTMRTSAQELPTKPAATSWPFSSYLVLIVDAMSLFHRAWHAGEPSKVHAVRSMFDTVGNMLDRVSPEFIVFAYDGGCDHRRRLLPSYKTHRPEKPPGMPEQIELMERAIDAIGWPSIRVPGWEADDILATLARQLQGVADSVLLATSDKDAFAICATTDARVYHPWKGGQIWTEAACDEHYGVPYAYMHGYLSLCGDSVDGVPGVDGVGKKTAADLMRQHRGFVGVLAAAERGEIKGAAGRKLREQIDQARLSYQLVQLCDSLPIGTEWQSWSIDDPRTGWRESLQSMGLGGVAQRLSERLKKSKPRAESAHTTVDLTGWTYADERDAVSSNSQGAGQTVVDQSASQSTVSDTGTVSADVGNELCSPDADRPREDDRVSAENSGGSSSDLTIPAGNNESVARRVYEQALEYFFEGVAAVSGYHKGTLLHAAWTAGVEGDPFESIDLAAYDHFGRPIRKATRCLLT